MCSLSHVLNLGFIAYGEFITHFTKRQVQHTHCFKHFEPVSLFIWKNLPYLRKPLILLVAYHNSVFKKGFALFLKQKRNVLYTF